MLNNRLFCLLIFLTCLIAFPDSAVSQNHTQSLPWNEKIFTGGSFGFQFGNYGTLVDLSPTIGYYISENFAIGTGISYKHYRLEDLYMFSLAGGDIRSYDHVANILGTGLFLRYYFYSEDIPMLNNVFGHLEYEFIKYEFNEYRPNESYTDVLKSRRTRDISSCFAGGGYRQFIGDRAFMFILILWNFNETIDSPYDNPVFRIGLNFGI